MTGNKHTIQELQELQALPLELKISMTKSRIRSWVKEFGEDGIYVAFSGGKDSTVLLDLVRQEFPNIPAMFVDTGLEYPEIRKFVKQFDNVDWIKPKMTFRQVIERYGYPFISKEVSECVYGARKFLRGGGTNNSTANCRGPENTRKSTHLFEYNKLCGQGKYAPQNKGGTDNKYRKLRGLGEYSRQSKNSFWSNDDGEYP